MTRFAKFFCCFNKQPSSTQQNTIQTLHTPTTREMDLQFRLEYYRQVALANQLRIDQIDRAQQIQIYSNLQQQQQQPSIQYTNPIQQLPHIHHHQQQHINSNLPLQQQQQQQQLHPNQYCPTCDAIRENATQQQVGRTISRVISTLDQATDLFSQNHSQQLPPQNTSTSTSSISNQQQDDDDNDDHDDHDQIEKQHSFHSWPHEQMQTIPQQQEQWHSDILSQSSRSNPESTPHSRGRHSSFDSNFNSLLLGSKLSYFERSEEKNSFYRQADWSYHTSITPRSDVVVEEQAQSSNRSIGPIALKIFKETSIEENRLQYYIHQNTQIPRRDSQNQCCDETDNNIRHKDTKILTIIDNNVQAGPSTNAPPPPTSNPDNSMKQNT